MRTQPERKTEMIICFYFLTFALFRKRRCLLITNKETNKQITKQNTQTVQEQWNETQWCKWNDVLAEWNIQIRFELSTFPTLQRPDQCREPNKMIYKIWRVYFVADGSVAKTTLETKSRKSKCRSFFVLHSGKSNKTETRVTLLDGRGVVFEAGNEWF